MLNAKLMVIAAASIAAGLCSAPPASAEERIQIQNVGNDRVLAMSNTTIAVHLIPVGEPADSGPKYERRHWRLEKSGKGELHFVNIFENKVLDRKDGGDELILWNPNGGANQLWTSYQVSPGIWIIQSRLDGKVLAAEGGGSKLTVVPKTEAALQRWRVLPPLP